MNEERKRILNMLAEGKISVDETEKLLAAVANSTAREIEPVKSVASAQDNGGKIPRYLYVTVNPKVQGSGEKVNIRVPLSLLKAGMKLAALIPKDAQDKVNMALGEKGVNIDISNLKAENIDEFLQTLGELTVDVDAEDEIVKVYCE
jgi:hypothetical protein